jgi:hypothetical protein
MPCKACLPAAALVLTLVAALASYRRDRLLYLTEASASMAPSGADAPFFNTPASAGHYRPSLRRRSFKSFKLHWEISVPWPAHNSFLSFAPSQPQAQPEEVNAEPEGEAAQDQNEEEPVPVHPSKAISNAEGRAPAIIIQAARWRPNGYVKIEMSMLAFECTLPTATYYLSLIHPVGERRKPQAQSPNYITEATQLRAVNRSLLAVNDGSNFLFSTLILSVYGNIRDASMAPKSPPCLSATPTGPANYGVTKEFAELYVGYYPEGLDVPQNEKRVPQ